MVAACPHGVPQLAGRPGSHEFPFGIYAQRAKQPRPGLGWGKREATEFGTAPTQSAVVRALSPM